MRTTLLIFCLLGYACISIAQTEICNNNLDDDGDGLIDCYDLADCPCASDHDCTLQTTKMPLTLDLLWESSGGFYNTTPIVGNLNPWADSIPEVIIATNANNLAGPYGFFILKGDGSNQNNPGLINIGIDWDYNVTMPAIADLDRDGRPEVFLVCADKKIRVYTNYNPAANPVMELWATSTDTCLLEILHAYSADFDGDGISEIYAGSDVFGFDLSNPAAPVLSRLGRGVGPRGEVSSRFCSTIAVDLLTPADCNGDPDCAGLEIAAGYGIYSVDLDPNDGDGIQIKLQRNINTTSAQAFSDGFTAVADMDLDGIQEVVVSGIRNQQVGIYVWNKTGFWRFLPMNIATQSSFVISPGAYSIGNVFDDRTQGFATDWPEIMLRYGKQMRCFNLHPASGFWWSNNTLLNDDDSGHGVVSTYDFDNNGLAELIVLDEDSLRICYGGSAPFPANVNGNRTITAYPCRGSTTLDIPVLADIDGNGNPEILAHHFLGSANVRLRVIQPKNPDYTRWLPARNIWNQYAYHVVNINDDLTVPIVQQAGNLEMPAPGSGKRPLNTFLSQRPAYFHPDATPYFPSADLRVEVKSVICLLPTFNITLEVCNLGDSPSADTTKIRFYRAGNPFSSPISNSFGGTFTVSTQSIPPGACVTLTVMLPVASGNIYAVLNDWGNFPTPLPAGEAAFYRPECDLQNNVAIFKMDLANGMPVSIGPDQVVCGGETISLTATSGFASYLWQNGATAASIQVAQPGLYWVETKDLCFNTRRDSMIIIQGENFQTIQAAVCADAFFSFQGQDILAGTTQSFVYTNLNGCDSTIFVQVDALPKDTTEAFTQICAGDSTLVFGNYVQLAGVFSQNFLNISGCDSMHTITVSLFPAPVPSSELRQICTGDSTQVFGNFVKTAGVFSQSFSNANACDSTHTITVSLFPAPVPSSELRQICIGDSTLVFGNFVKTAGVFSQSFPNANSCDSMHTITVNLFSAPVPSSELRQICTGDSTLVFGNFVKTSGVFSQSFLNANACDSTHTITVSLFPAPVPSSELRQICTGDSTLVFGNFVKTAGVFSQSFPNANSCDSTHTITVSLFPAPVPSTELRQICAGDSTLVFGNFVKTAGVFSQSFPNANSCDSTHTITVSLFPAPVPSSELRQICAGDSTLVFGNFVKTAGVFSQSFPNVNACDSTHTITVSLFPGPVPSTELRQICTGDSTLVFGNFVKTAGVFSQSFPNSSGCDSLHQIVVNLFTAPTLTSEDRKICAGDSTLIFGSLVHLPGVYARTFSNADGCDSTHFVNLSLLPAVVSTSEMRQICPGDSTQIFGNFIKVAGAYAQSFPNINGCDSSHTVILSFLPAPTPSSEMRQICTGDSTLVFGNYVTSAGVFSQNFSSASGCDSVHTIAVESVEQYAFSGLVPLCPGDSVWVLGNWVQQPGQIQQLVPGDPGCDTLWTIEVQGIQPPALNLQITQPSAQQANGEIQVLGTSSAQYSLDGIQFAQQNIFKDLTPGAYVLYQQFEGCVESAPFVILPYFEEPKLGVFAPNIFAPGTNNGNERFTLFASPDYVENLDWLRIYDRWGSMVFEQSNFAPNDPSKGWDGLIGGKLAAPGVYFWQANLQYSGGKSELKKGDLTVLR